jgi:hypothetical protein
MSKLHCCTLQHQSSQAAGCAALSAQQQLLLLLPPLLLTTPAAAAYFLAFCSFSTWTYSTAVQHSNVQHTTAWELVTHSATGGRTDANHLRLQH